MLLFHVEGFLKICAPVIWTQHVEVERSAEYTIQILTFTVKGYYCALLWSKYVFFYYPFRFRFCTFFLFGPVFHVSPENLLYSPNVLEAAR